jgi:hypothetical protein
MADSRRLGPVAEVGLASYAVRMARKIDGKPSKNKPPAAPGA